MVIGLLSKHISRAFFSQQSISKNQKMKLFIAHFEKQSKIYEMPLLSSLGLLSYTGRFTQTIINNKWKDSERAKYFMLIKRSIVTQKKLTISSAILLCQGLISFKFEGEENKILQKLRNFIKQNQRILTSIQADRFNLAYKYLMVSRASGPIKFKDISINSSKNARQYLEESIKHVFKIEGLSKFKIDLIGKRQVFFDISLDKISKKLKFMVFKQKNMKDIQLQVAVKKIVEQARSQRQVLILRSSVNKLINKKELQNRLLKSQKIYHFLEEQKQMQTSSASNKDKIIQLMLSKTNIPAKKIKITSADPIKFLNHVLQNSTLAEIKEAYGYLKLNLFHIQLEQILNLIGKAKRSTVPQLSFISYLNILQQQQYNLYKLITNHRYQAHAVVELIKQSDCKNITIVCDEQALAATLSDIFSICKQLKVDESKMQQNNQNNLLLQKLAFISLVYQIPIPLNNIMSVKIHYRKLLHPITYPFRSFQFSSI